VRLPALNKSITTTAPEVPDCYRAHRAIPGARCASCGLDVERGPYDAEQWIRNFGVERVYGPSKPDIGRAGEPSAAHRAAKDALDLADAVYQVAVSRLLDVTRRLSGPRTAAEDEELMASEFAAHEEVREAAERSQRARVRFNREDRALGLRIIAAQRKAEGRS